MGKEKSSTEIRLNNFAFAWLADAPLLIDADQVGRIYDAVVQPEYEQGMTQLSFTSEVGKRIAGKIGMEATVEPGALVSMFNKLFNLKLAGKGEAEGEAKSEKGKGITVELRPIKTPQRQLVQLTLHYVVNHDNRIFLASNSHDSWPTEEDILLVPRGIIFLDLLPGTQIIPTAAEFEGGEVVQLFVELQKGNAPKYPDRGSVEELVQQRRNYWKWYQEHVTPTDAMLSIENAAKTRSAIRWIDYRIMLSDEGHTAHLHVCPGGQYDTGVLAYNLVKRGNKHGLRIVGALKCEPDVNVLAIYEK